MLFRVSYNRLKCMKLVEITTVLYMLMSLM